jgi:outer membrane biogenesis lipoprotein LolB
MPNARREVLDDPRRRQLSFCVVHCALGLALSGCAARAVTLPTDPGVPFNDFAQVHAQLTEACRGVRTLTTELALAGRAGSERLRGRVLAGFERPASMRLEGVAPLGPPAFILAARGTMAVLLLPREDRVLKGERAADMLGALTGVALAPADLQAILTGCVTADPKPTSGRLHADGWASIELEGGARVFLRREGEAWQVRAARREGWQIEYPAWQSRFPQSLRLRSDRPGANVDLTATLSQVESNVDIDPAAFSVDVPASAASLTLDELRASGPLRGQ